MININPRVALLAGALALPGAFGARCVSQYDVGRGCASQVAREIDAIPQSAGFYMAPMQTAVDIIYSEPGMGLIDLVGLAGAASLTLGAFGYALTRRRGG